MLHLTPLLNGVLEDEYHTHLQLLVSSLTVLFSSNITHEALLKVEKDLYTFVYQFEVFYLKIYSL